MFFSPNLVYIYIYLFASMSPEGFLGKGYNYVYSVFCSYCLVLEGGNKCYFTIATSSTVIFVFVFTTGLPLLLTILNTVH